MQGSPKAFFNEVGRNEFWKQNRKLETTEASGHYFRMMKHSEASERLWDCCLAHLKKGLFLNCHQSVWFRNWTGRSRRLVYVASRCVFACVCVSVYTHIYMFFFFNFLIPWIKTACYILVDAWKIQNPCLNYIIKHWASKLVFYSCWNIFSLSLNLL